MDISVFRHLVRESDEDKYEFNTTLPKRPPQGNSTGKEVTIRLNSFNILKYPDKSVFQYDVLVGSGIEKRGLIQKVWNSQLIKKTLAHPSWIFDGNRLAWSLEDKRPDLTLIVDLDAEAGRTPRGTRENKFRVVIRQTNKVNLAVIPAYLSGKMDFDKSVLEGINFLDHLLRQDPSSRLVAIKQSFFARPLERHSLTGAVEAFKGVYQTIRACESGRLGVNVDVSNGTFWIELEMEAVMMILTNGRESGQMNHALKDVPMKGNESVMVKSPAFKELRRLKKVGFYVAHRGGREKNFEDKTYYVNRFSDKNAWTHKFDVRDKVTGEVTKDVCVYDYYKKKYNVYLEWPELPLIETVRDGLFPVEVCRIAHNQRYVFKLNDQQTSAMIRFAVTRPERRIKDIQFGLSLLKWSEDPFLKGYGMEISPQMVQTKARVLPPPTIQFLGSTISPGTSGRWDLKGPRKFLLPNPTPLNSWGVLICRKKGLGATVDKEVVVNFMREFIKGYQTHGGLVMNRNPPIIEGSADAATGALQLYKKVAALGKGEPQMLVFILPNRDAFHYQRIKKSCDCRFGVVSQCMQAEALRKINQQYISNVCMKFNAKLGGTTSRVMSRNVDLGHFGVPSMIIGADVSHAAPLSEAPSMAAMTVMMDRIGVRYAASVQTNGHRVEMITTSNIRSMLMPLMGHWVQKVNGGRPPEHIYYFRDGVSEGQYQHVLQQEVKDFKQMLEAKVPGYKPKFIVVVASKRHHIRFFPKPNDRVAADKNGNPVPGTLVEHDVTHPNENDFYLCSHSAIQGTARPVHYHVLLDEAGLSINSLHALIYEQCYAYIRSTTPVSLHPAIYYAHLASNRARCHENFPSSGGPRTTPSHSTLVKREKGLIPSAKPTTVEEPPLLTMPNNLDREMWYI